MAYIEQFSCLDRLPPNEFDNTFDNITSVQSVKKYKCMYINHLSTITILSTVKLSNFVRKKIHIINFRVLVPNFVSECFHAPIHSSRM